MGEEERNESSYLAGKARAGVEVLRRLCATHGDLDWGDDLHLADVIDKHLGKYLEE